LVPFNEIQHVRDDIERFFDRQAPVAEEAEVFLSPDGRYSVNVEVYRQTDPGRNWCVCEAVVMDAVTKAEVVRIKSAEDRFWHGWVTKDGVDYLVCSEALGGQTVIDLSRRSIASYYATDDPFIWTEFHPSPDRQKLAILGCYWACPYEVVVYDFNDPMSLPLRPLMRADIEAHEEFLGWISHGEFRLGKQAGEFRTIQVP
jgi:hypothetical protein